MKVRGAYNSMERGNCSHSAQQRTTKIPDSSDDDYDDEDNDVDGDDDGGDGLLLFWFCRRI